MADDQGQLDEVPADPVAVAREIALRQLTVRSRTVEELRRAMSRKGVPDEAADEVVDRFSEVGLLDDATFARDWVAGGARRSRSSRVLAQELKAKGVDPEVIGEALADRDPDADLEVARALAARKVRSLAGLDRAVQYRRLAAALARRGFPSAVVAAVVGETLQGPSEQVGR